MNLFENLTQLHNKIAFFIKNYIDQNNGFQSRSFYGETFSLNLLQMNGLLDQRTKDILIKQYERLDKNDRDFHWEFNNYALLNYLRISNDKQIKKFLQPLKFKNTPVTNWTLLRSNARLLASQDMELAIREAKEKINKYQLESGLILDKKEDKSFQYHCFSAAMIGELYEQTQDMFFFNSFQKAVKFIRNFILSNGETLYIGRGQNQSFGYGALLYLLALAYKYSSDTTILGDMTRVYVFLVQFQNEDGSFPLVMNGLECEIPTVANPKDTNYPGWYPYNNYFDYLPFMGYFIAKACALLQKLDISHIMYAEQKPYEDKHFIKVVRSKYEAVVSKPGGYWTNDMPIPYIVYKKQSITPVYGGEQFQSSFYSLEGMPLPWCRIGRVSIRKFFYASLVKKYLFIFSIFGWFYRKYEFNEGEIIITSHIFSPLFCKHIYLFKKNIELADKRTLKSENFDVISDSDFVFHSFEYSASGLLRSFRVKARKNKLIIRLK